MRQFTVHDMSHVDALWDLASRIAGEGVVANFTPTEAFVLGGAAIVHDLGLSAAAYQGTYDQIRSSDSYRAAYALAARRAEGQDHRDLDHSALGEVIRVEHADKAIDLATEGWDHPSAGTLYLIESVSLRTAYGWLIGRIGASHGWSSDKVAAEFHQEVNQPSGFPPSWSVDPLKLACLLRLADAAHLDGSRAPRLLRVARNPEGTAALHWTFQEHLQGVSVSGDRIRFSAGEPLALADAPAWWLGFDMIRAVDEEFRSVDSLLADLGKQRFQVNGVLGAESPARFANNVPTQGWTPVNAQIHVADVATLVERLGGAHLYGFDTTAALRELIQNSADSVRLRRLIESRPSDWGDIKVTIDQGSDGAFLEITDTGVGMTDPVIGDHLLNFGGSLWNSVDVAKLIPDFDPDFRPTGQFGIGFFSIFMLGQRVRITTRPRAAGPDETKVLEIDQLSRRPVLRQAETTERLSEPGTQVRVWLRKTHDGPRPIKRGSVDLPRWASSGPAADGLARVCAFVCPALDCRIQAETSDSEATALRANDWLQISAPELWERVHPPTLMSLEPHIPDDEPAKKYPSLAKLDAWLTVIKNDAGHIIGRAAIPAVDTPRVSAIIAVGGLRSHMAEGLFGIFLGQDPSLSRDSASLVATPSDLRRWANDQAIRYAEAEEQAGKHSYFAASVLSYGGDLGPLKLCRDSNGTWLDEEQLSVKVADSSSVEISPDLDRPQGDPARKVEKAKRARANRKHKTAADLQIIFVRTPDALAPPWTGSGHRGDIRAHLESIVRRAWGGGAVVNQDDERYILSRP